MNVKFPVFAVALLAVLLLAGAGADTPAFGQVTVPNTFTAGSPAVAADVNANFQALADAINALGIAPITNDGSLDALHYTGGTAAAPNVVVMGGKDNAGNLYYVVRTAWVGAGGPEDQVSGTAYAYLRNVVFLRVESGTGNVDGYSVKQGTDTLTTAAGTEEVWQTAIYSYTAVAPGSTLNLAAVLSRERQDGYKCHTPAISGLVRHCRHSIRSNVPSTFPSEFRDASRIMTASATSFAFNGLTFANGGVTASFLAESSDREAFVIAKDVGIVLETRRWGNKGGSVITAGNPLMVTTYGLYYRISGFGEAGAANLTGTIFDTGGQAAGQFY